MSYAYVYGAFIWGMGRAYDWGPGSSRSSFVQTPRSDLKLEYYLEGPEDKCYADWKCKFRPQFSVHVFTNQPASAEAKGRMGIRAETFDKVCGESIASGGLKKVDTQSWKIKASYGENGGSAEFTYEEVIGELAHLTELIDPSSGAGEGSINDGNVSNENKVGATLSGDVEINVSADGWHAGLVFNTGIAQADVTNSRYGLEITGQCTDETLESCECEDTSGEEKNEYVFSLN